MDNINYVRVDNIYQRLAQRLKGREIPFDDIVEWCAEFVINEIGQYTDWFRYQDVKITDIEDRQFELPAKCFYVKNVKIDTGYTAKYVNFYINGNYLNLEQDYSTVYIDYYAYPYDSVTGYILIPRGHEQAAFFYCIKQLHYEEYLEGKISESKWASIQYEYETAAAKAISRSNKTSDNERVDVLDAQRVINYNYKDPTRR
jgi:hypothetical protein